MFYMFCEIFWIPICDSQGASVDSYWYNIELNNSTYVQLCITFNFSVEPLSNCVLFNILF